MHANRRQAIALSLLAMSAAATRSWAAEDKRKFLISHGFQSHHAAMVKTLVARFMERHAGVQTDVFTAGDNWDKHLQGTLRAALVNDLPDVSHQSLNYTGQLTSKKLALPFEEFSGNAVKLTDLGISNAMVRSVTFGGKVYAVPFGTTLPVIYYNADLLQRVGYNKSSPPASWAEIIMLVEQISKLGDGIVGGYVEYSAANAWMFQNLLASLGGRMVNDDETQILFDGDAGLQALKILQDFGAAAKTDLTQNQARQSFNAGSLGVLVRSASGIPSVSKAAEGKFRLLIGNFPIPAGDGSLVGAGNGVVVFAKDPAKQRTAFDYVRYITSAEGQAIMVTMTGYMPVSSLAIKNNPVLEEFYKNEPQQAVFADMVSRVSDWYAFPKNPVKTFDAITEQLRLVSTGQARPADALKAMSAAAKLAI